MQNNISSIAVIITCHNRKDHTLNCLSFLYKSIALSRHSIDVYIVDDRCIDGTAIAVKKDFKKVKIVNGNGNLFWNRGMNLAWKTARKNKDYDFYLWLNDDTQIKIDALKKLLQTNLEKGNKSIIVGSTCSFNEGNQVTYGGWQHNKTLLMPQKIAIKCDYFNGNIVLIPKYVFHKVGFNDFRFRHSLGDFDYGLRASKLGISIYVAPGFLGKCNLHSSLSVWCDANKSFLERWKSFRSPLGQNPEEFFLFTMRHRGIFNAIYYYFANHLRLIAPSLWSKEFIHNSNKK